jgi:hypothetical protein
MKLIPRNAPHYGIRIYDDGLIRCILKGEDGYGYDDVGQPFTIGEFAPPIKPALKITAQNHEKKIDTLRKTGGK